MSRQEAPVNPVIDSLNRGNKLIGERNRFAALEKRIAALERLTEAQGREIRALKKVSKETTTEG